MPWGRLDALESVANRPIALHVIDALAGAGVRGFSRSSRPNAPPRYASVCSDVHMTLTVLPCASSACPAPWTCSRRFTV